MSFRGIGDAFVQHQSLVDVVDVIIRYQGGDAKVYLDTGMQRFIRIWYLALFERFDGAFEQFAVEGEADFGYLAALAFTEQLAGATDLEVVSRQ